MIVETFRPTVVLITDSKQVEWSNLSRQQLESVAEEMFNSLGECCKQVNNGCEAPHVRLRNIRAVAIKARRYAGAVS